MQDKNWLAQQLDLLLTGHGYNLYNDANRARADDLLVRQHACGLLGEAANHLGRLATDYTANRLPPSTRDHPFPTAAEIAPLKQLQALRAEVSTLASRIRGLSVPTQDRVWARFRTETTTLEFLLSSDYHLITAADKALNTVLPASAATWTEEIGFDLQNGLREVEQLTRDREQFLKSST